MIVRLRKRNARMSVKHTGVLKRPRRSAKLVMSASKRVPFPMPSNTTMRVSNALLTTKR